MKVLVINGHPTPKESAAGKAILNAFLKQRPDAIVRTLAERKADSPTGFDVEAEQAALADAPWYIKMLDALFFYQGADGQAVASSGE